MSGSELCYQCKKRKEHELVDIGTFDIFRVCPRCYSHAYRCTVCGRRMPTPDHGVRRWERDADGDPAMVLLCPDCYAASQQEPGDWPLQVYNYDPPEFLLTGDGPPYFGVELEAEGGDEATVAQEIMATTPLLYCKCDGSLRHGGFEIVSHPCTLDVHLNQLPWLDVLTRLSRYGYRSHDARASCGLHVHISRDGFVDSAAITRMVLFVELHYKHILRMSRRTAKAMDRWAARYANRYLTNYPELVARDVEQKVKTLESRYTIVNLQSPDTVELRFFRGTLRPDTFFAAIEFADVLRRIGNDIDTQDILTGSFRDTIEQYGGRYLPQYMKRRGYYDKEGNEGSDDVNG